jgi:hypothetical protein
MLKFYFKVFDKFRLKHFIKDEKIYAYIKLSDIKSSGVGGWLGG